MPEEPRVIDMQTKQGPPLKLILVIALGILVIMIGRSLIYTIEPEEVGIVSRLVLDDDHVSRHGGDRTRGSTAARFLPRRRGAICAPFSIAGPIAARSGACPRSAR